MDVLLEVFQVNRILILVLGFRFDQFHRTYHMTQLVHGCQSNLRHSSFSFATRYPVYSPESLSLYNQTLAKSNGYLSHAIVK